MQIIHTMLHLLQLNDKPQEKWIDCSHDDATLALEHLGQYTNFNLQTPITSGVKLEMEEVLAPSATVTFGILKNVKKCL